VRFTGSLPVFPDYQTAASKMLANRRQDVGAPFKKRFLTAFAAASIIE